MEFLGPLAVDVVRTLRTYVATWRAAQHLLDDTVSPGARERSLAAGVLVAFTFEGYLNHAGVVLLDSWDEVERKLNWRSKLLLLAEVLATKLDLGAEPFQSLPSLFKFRDALAHGKTSSVRREDQPMPEALDSLHAMIHDATVPWEVQCEPATITKWMNAVRLAVEALHASLMKHPRVPEQEPPDPFALKSQGTATVKVVKGQ